LARNTSHPSAVDPLQFAYPERQLNPHVPPVHVGDANAALGQTFPHAAQLSGLLLVLTSQPSTATPLQFPKPALQLDTAHAPAVHLGVALGVTHAAPHAPQLRTSEFGSTSQPFVASRSQSRKSPVHATVHAPALHAAVALARIGQTLLQRPQLRASSVKSDSQPFDDMASQSPRPATHVSEHVPVRHIAVAYGPAGHVRKHAPQ